MSGRTIAAIGAAFVAAGPLGGCAYYDTSPSYVYVPCAAPPAAPAPPGSQPPTAPPPPSAKPPAGGTPSATAAQCLAPAPVYAYPAPGYGYPYYYPGYGYPY
jgi:hypothetical protein